MLLSLVGWEMIDKQRIALKLNLAVFNLHNIQHTLFFKINEMISFKFNINDVLIMIMFCNESHFVLAMGVLVDYQSQRQFYKNCPLNYCLNIFPTYFISPFTNCGMLSYSSPMVKNMLFSL